MLEWDSGFWRRRVARVCPGADHVAADRWLADHRADVAFALEPLAEVARIQLAEALGYRVTDVRVTLARPPAEPEAYDQEGIREHRPSDLQALEKIASRAHRDSRFYADRRFPRQLCDELYRTWIREACGDENAVVLVSVDDRDQPAGYVVVRPGAGTSKIDLIAVAEAAQRQGRGRQLVGAALSLARRHAGAPVTAATQGRNVAAQALYQSWGFRSSAVEVWLHRWGSHG
jgi:ribosomal protein S18 acetylase RimI-like enzyme